MKIRNGFVSNSSSSSFVVYGVPVTAYEVVKFLETVSETFSKKLFEDDYLNKLLNEYDPYELQEAFRTYFANDEDVELIDTNRFGLLLGNSHVSNLTTKEKMSIELLAEKITNGRKNREHVIDESWEE